jgi:hypothetical protein
MPRGPGPEFDAAVDAKASQPPAEPVRWLDDPDPFGMDWQWAGPPSGPKPET